MTRLWSSFRFVFLIACLEACVSTGPQRLSARKGPDVLQRRVQMWLGVPRDYLEKYWGVAKSTKDMGMGLRYLTYRARGKSKTACAVVFTVDITNTVKGGEWSGDRRSCLRFVKEVPSAEGQQLVETDETQTLIRKLSLK